MAIQANGENPLIHGFSNNLGKLEKFSNDDKFSETIIPVNIIINQAIKLGQARSDNEIIEALLEFLEFIKDKSFEGIKNGFNKVDCSRINFLATRCIDKIKDPSGQTGALNYVKDKCNGYFTKLIDSEFGKFPRCISDFLQLVGAIREESEINDDEETTRVEIDGKRIKIMNQDPDECLITFNSLESAVLITPKSEVKEANILVDQSVPNQLREHPYTKKSLDNYHFFNLTKIDNGKFSILENSLSELLEQVSKNNAKDAFALKLFQHNFNQNI